MVESSNSVNSMAPNSLSLSNDSNGNEALQSTVPGSQGERRDRKVIAAAKALAAADSQSEILPNGIKLSWHNLDYPIGAAGSRRWWRKEKTGQDKQILFHLNGEVKPGQLLGLIGPEGSGKSLLLRILAGRLRDPARLQGVVTYNGQPFASDLRRNIGFVASVSHVLENLTVKESLMYAAQLRLPQDTEDIDRVVRVEHVLDSLELTQCANVIVGKSGVTKGVLNNERRRLAIGMEMITNPPLLILDEPTIGLDGAMSLRITRMLAAYAAAGRTVVASYEMPSRRMFELFNLLLLIAEGHPIYSGPADEAMAYFESHGHKPSPDISPAEYLLDLAVAEPSDASIHYGTTTNLIQAWRRREGLTGTGLPLPGRPQSRQPWKDDEVGGMQEVLVELPAKVGKNDKRWVTSWVHQFQVLLHRNAKSYRNWDLGALPIFIIVAFSALVTGCLWYQRPNTSAGVRDLSGAVFFVALFWGLLPMISTVLTFYQDRLLLRQEQEAGIYHISAYFTSRIILYLPYEVLCPLLFGAIVYWMVGLNSSFGRFVLFELLLVLDCMVASSVGLAVGAIARTAKQAIFIATWLQLLTILVGDFLVLHEPSWISWTKYLSFSTYIHRLLLRVNFSENGTYKCDVLSAGAQGNTYVSQDCPYSESPELKGRLRAIDGGGSVEAVVLLCMLVGYRFIAYLFLKNETKTRRQQHPVLVPSL